VIDISRATRFSRHEFISLIQFTSDPRAAWPLRVPVEPSEQNGLAIKSQAMIDAIYSVRATRVGQIIGQLAVEDMRAVERALLVYLGYAD
jgi:mRNA interferase MazF